MLISLCIKNAALIEEAELTFDKGLNILTGETGAGKSMIADSLSFILGRRPAKDFVQAGAERALVSCVIEVGPENKERLTELGIEIDYDNIITIERGLYDTGKSISRVNGRTVSVGTIKDIADTLFDLHSQHEHQSLLKSSRHIDILDKFTDPAITELKNNLAIILKDLQAAEAEISSLLTDTSDIESRIELYNYQINEIEAADFKPDEEEKLVSRRKILNASREIAELAKTALIILSSGAPNAMDCLVSGSKALGKLADLDDACAGIASETEDIVIRLDEIIRDLRAYKSGLSHSPDELKQIDDRLDLIYNLKRKYGRTIPDILLFLEKTKRRYELLANAGERLDTLNKIKEDLRAKAACVCAEISVMRKSAAEGISKKVEQNLKELEMKDAAFKVSFEQKTDFTPNGYDKIEFLISANEGAGLKPLAETASGGEISRVMLALKTVLASADTAQTLVFDEIDTGLSGKTAQKTAEKLSRLSKTRQLICITHLPQIAAMADKHFLIEKTSQSGKTTAGAAALDEEQIHSELARLIGGAKITEATVAAAAELRVMAKRIVDVIE